MKTEILNHLATRKEQVAGALGRRSKFLRMTGVLFLMGLVTAPVEAANFSELAALIVSIGTILDAIITIVPKVITVSAYFAVGTFIVGMLSVLLVKASMK